MHPQGNTNSTDEMNKRCLIWHDSETFIFGLSCFSASVPKSSWSWCFVCCAQLFEGNELHQSRSFLGNDNDIFKMVVFHDLGLSSINLQPSPCMRRPCACVASEKRLVSSSNSKCVMSSCLTHFRFLLVSCNPSSSSRPSIAGRSA